MTGWLLAFDADGRAVRAPDRVDIPASLHDVTTMFGTDQEIARIEAWARGVKVEQWERPAVVGQP